MTTEEELKTETLTHLEDLTDQLGRDKITAATAIDAMKSFVLFYWREKKNVVFSKAERDLVDGLVEHRLYQLNERPLEELDGEDEDEISSLENIREKLQASMVD